MTRSGRCVNAWPTGSLLTGIDLPSRASIIEMMSPQESGSGPPNEIFRFNAVALLRAATANAATSAAAINECLRSPLPIKKTGRFFFFYFTSTIVIYTSMKTCGAKIV